MKALTTLLVVAMVLMPVAIADDADDVRAAVERYITAINAGDSSAIQYRTSERSTFGRGGGLLSKPTSSLQEQRSALSAEARAGVKRNYQITHMEVSVYGDTAVVTGYLTGTRTQPNGNTIVMRDRRTGVFVKQGGQWKEVHHHQSPLRGPQ